VNIAFQAVMMSVLQSRLAPALRAVHGFSTSDFKYASCAFCSVSKTPGRGIGTTSIVWATSTATQGCQRLISLSTRMKRPHQGHRHLPIAVSLPIQHTSLNPKLDEFLWMKLDRDKQVLHRNGSKRHNIARTLCISTLIEFSASPSPSSRSLPPATIRTGKLCPRSLGYLARTFWATVDRLDANILRISAPVPFTFRARFVLSTINDEWRIGIHLDRLRKMRHGAMGDDAPRPVLVSAKAVEDRVPVQWVDVRS
jgi:hypothetical protein